MRARREIVRSALADQVYETLRDRIRDVEVAPGERLVIDQLARDLGVSQTPVRDALARLAGEGFIVSMPFRGFTVLPVPDVDEIEESFEARTMVEAAAARLACERASNADLAALGDLQAQIVSLRDGPRPEGYAPFDRINRQFHETLVAASGNRFFGDAHRAIDHDARMARTMYRLRVRELSSIVAEHEEILAALADREPDRAAAAIARHNAEGLKRVLAVRRQRDEAS